VTYEPLRWVKRSEVCFERMELLRSEISGWGKPWGLGGSVRKEQENGKQDGGNSFMHKKPGFKI
jgi:hypothetical protein